MMDAANSMPGEPADELGEFRARLKAHIERAEPGSLAALVADAPRGESVDPAAQFTHWLFAMGDTLAINAFRALCAIASHPAERDLVLAEIDAAGELDGRAIAGLGRLGGLPARGDAPLALHAHALARAAGRGKPGGRDGSRRHADPDRQHLHASRARPPPGGQHASIPTPG